jgi:hypothetical protein
LVGFFQSEYKSGCYIYLYIFFSLIVGWHFVNKGCVQSDFYNPLFILFYLTYSFYLPILYPIEENRKNINFCGVVRRKIV